MTGAYLTYPVCRRDGIIKSFSLKEDEFLIVLETPSSDKGIIYKAMRFDKDEKECFGYIRYHKGIIEICNRAATLQPEHLIFGGSTKSQDGDSNQAGAHGEGLKLAALVMLRSPQNHGIRCRSGGYNWTFNFANNNQLVARLRGMSPESIKAAKQQSDQQCKRGLVPFAADPAHDVQFIIGERPKGRDENGEKVQRVVVSPEDFDKWTQAALFLHQQALHLQNPNGEKGISTAWGDLLDHEDLRGSIYLKGLLLGESTPGSSASISKLPLKFGYNFAEGKTNRERQSVLSADDEGIAIRCIWTSVLQRPDDSMVEKLSDMLNDAETDWADVQGARWRMGPGPAKYLIKYLDSFAGRWYYCAEEKVRGDTTTSSPSMTC